jgi:hypothetical protein
MTTYINGTLCHQATNLDPSDLRLHHKLVVLGGGKLAHARGGDIRRLCIHSAALNSDAIKEVFLSTADDSPAIGGRALQIQRIYRGFKARKTYLAKKNARETDGDESSEQRQEKEEEEKQEQGKGEEEKIVKEQQDEQEQGKDEGTVNEGQEKEEKEV